MRKNKTIRTALTVMAASLAATSVSRAGQVLSVTFDSADGGNNIATVTGGTATLKGNATVSTSSPDLGAGGYLHTPITPGASSGATITPTSAANSFAALAPTSTSLSGGFDFFFRSDTSFNGDGSSGLHPIEVSTVSNGTYDQLSLKNGFGSAPVLELLGSFSNVSGALNSNGSSTIYIGNNIYPTAGVVAGNIYHIGATFSTDINGLVTAKLFRALGTGAIDTTSTADLLGSATFNVANAALPSGSFVFGTNDGPPSGPTNDLDTFRLYDSAPVTFAAQSVPEPASLGLMLIGVSALAVRRRRA